MTRGDMARLQTEVAQGSIATARSSHGAYRRREHGAALLIVLIGLGVITSAALGLSLMTDTEIAMSNNVRAGQELTYAADAMAERVIAELLPAASWTPYLSGATLAFAGSAMPTTPYGETLSIAALTSQVQTLMSAPAAWGPNAPVWNAIAHGPMSALNGPGSVRSLAFLTAWIGDDPGEIDGDPRTDANGVVSIVAQARGVGGGRRTVVATLGRQCRSEQGLAVPAERATAAPACAGGEDPLVRVLSWREI